jgi:glycosyltransferase involved in cell wall biosynthesis
LEVAEEAKRHNLPMTIFRCDGRLDIGTILSIRKFLERHEINLVHSHGYKSNLYALAASLGKSQRRVATCHNWLGETRKMRFYARLDKFFLNRFDAVIAVSDSVKQEMLNHNLSAGKVSIICNGIDTNRFNNPNKVHSVRREFGIDESCKVIGTVGRLAEEKGHVYLLHAAKQVLHKYPEVIFLIVGDGPLKGFLERECSQLAETGYLRTGCPKGPVVFAGIRNDIPDIYMLMDIFVLPSLVEGLPMALLEAMASQRPVVATKVGGIPKVVEHGHCGLLIQPGDVNSLAKAILDLLANPEKGHWLAKHARQKVEQQFSSRVMAERYVEVYQDVLGTSNTGG